MIILNSNIWAATVEEAKAKAAHSPEWLRTIEKADKQIRRARYWAYDATKGELKLMSASKSDIYTITADAHTCPAIENGHKACYHRAAHRLMVLYVSRLNAASVEVETKTAQAWNVETGTTTATHTRAIVTDSKGSEAVHGVYAVAPAHAPAPSNSIAAVEKAASIFPAKMLDFGKDVFAGRPRGVARRQQYDWRREF
jgi:hypothetical protein